MTNTSEIDHDLQGVQVEADTAWERWSPTSAKNHYKLKQNLSNWLIFKFYHFMSLLTSSVFIIYSRNENHLVDKRGDDGILQTIGSRKFYSVIE